MNKSLIIMCMALMLFSVASRAQDVKPGDFKYAVIPVAGFVPDEATAVAVATVILDRMYGKKQIDTETPLHATLKGDVWTVRGSLPKGNDGGVAEVELSKTDGRIIRVNHEQ